MSQSKGFSLRQSLTENGVTSEAAMREHLAFVHGTLKGNPKMRIDRYHPNPNYPNGSINHG